MSSGWAMAPPCRGPRRSAPGPKGYGSYTIYRHERRVLVSASDATDSGRSRGSQNRDRRPPLVRWALRCPPSQTAAGAGDPTVLSLPFPLLLLPMLPSCTIAGGDLVLRAMPPTESLAHPVTTRTTNIRTSYVVQPPERTTVLPAQLIAHCRGDSSAS